MSKPGIQTSEYLAIGTVFLIIVLNRVLELGIPQSELLGMLGTALGYAEIRRRAKQ